MITEEQWNEAMGEVAAKVAAHNATYLADPYSASYVRWMRLAAGLKLVMEDAKIEIPIMPAYGEPRSDDEGRLSFCMEVTHAVNIFYFHVGRGILTLEGLRAAMLLKGAETVKSIRRARGGHDYGQDVIRQAHAVEFAARRMREEWFMADADADILSQYRAAHPGKRRGTKHFFAYASAARLAAATAHRARSRGELVRALAASRITAAGPGGALEFIAGRRREAAALRLEADWLDALKAGPSGPDQDDVPEIIRDAARGKDREAEHVQGELERIYGEAEKLLAETPA